MKLFFPIETSNRELLPKLFLASKFAEIGYTSFVGAKSHIWNIIQYTSFPVYFDKGYHEGVSEGIYKNIIGQNGFIISLDEEIGIDLKDFSTLSKRFPDKVFDIFNLIFIWGEKQNDFLKKNRINYSEEKVTVSGHPRFELLKKEYRSIYSVLVENIKSKYGKYILLNTSFGFGNNILGDEFVVKNYESRIPNIKEYIYYEKKQVNYFIELVTELKRNLDLNIILRPHPEESHSIYLDNLGNINGVFIEYEHSVIPWILGSEVMIHHSCTTALEANMLGKFSIAYVKDVNENLVPWIPLELSQKFTSCNEIVEFIKAKKYKQISKKNTKLLLDYYSFFNNTTQQIVEKCDFYLESKKNINNKIDRKYIMYVLLSRIKDLIKLLIIPLKLRKENKLGKQKQKGLDKKNVISLFNRIKNNELIDENVRIKTINNSKLYKIY